MATSTFGKEFKIKKENSGEFVKEMKKEVAPTLGRDFHSRMQHEKELKQYLCKALNS